MPSEAGLPHVGNSAPSPAQVAVFVLFMLDMILALSLNIVRRLEARGNKKNVDEVLAAVDRTSRWMWKEVQSVPVGHLPALKEHLVEYERILKDLGIWLDNEPDSPPTDTAVAYIKRFDFLVLSTKTKLAEIHGFLPYADDPGPNIQNSTATSGIMNNSHDSNGFLPYADDPGPLHNTRPSSSNANFFQESQNVKILGGTFTINQGVRDSDSKLHLVQQQVSWIQLQIIVLFA